MAPDTLVRDAWRQVPSPNEIGRQLERFAGQRMERIIAIVVSVGSVALGAQSFVAAVSQREDLDAPHMTMLALAFGPLVIMVIACIAGRGVRMTAGIFTVCFLMVLVWWPWVASRHDQDPALQPWIFFLINVATVAGVLAFPLVGQIVVALLFPLVYGAVRLVQGEFAQEFWVTTAFDVSFTLILGFLLVALGWTFRSVAAGVDEARSQAVADYAEAAATAAVEQERVAIAGLMHDSVLAALIAAERARTDRERDLAVGMAREALTRLANAEVPAGREGSDEPILVEQITADLGRAIRELGVTATIDQYGTGAVPERVARAVDLAARQAIGNAVEHASAAGLTVIVEGHGVTGITVKVSDRGDGFDPEKVEPDRLGIRASIMARMAAVGGTVTIESDADGTMIILGWSAP